MTSLIQAWGALRASLGTFSFYDIKTISGLAGLDLTRVAHLEQKPEKGASKGQLMTAVDQCFGEMDSERKDRFTSIVAEEVLWRKPDQIATLEEHLSRLGWALTGNALVPVAILDPSAIEDLPDDARPDMIKAAQRFRDGDLSGAISAACGAVDCVTSRIYRDRQLGDPANASFQERCSKAVVASNVPTRLQSDLLDLGWPPEEITPFKKNFAGALNQGAYVMQTLRSKMGDVHGSKPILRPLVFDSIKWAELLIRAIEPDE